MTNIIAKLAVVVTAGATHPDPETLTDEQKKFLGLPIDDEQENA